MSETILLIGTRKGLWLARSNDGRASWRLDGPHFVMNDIYATAIDTRGDAPRLLAGATSEHWGPGVSYSDNLGRTWAEPAHGAIRFPADTGAALERVWQLRPGPETQPGVVYAGTEPSAVWRSDDGGESFTLLRGLWDHPHRENWFPGFGGQAFHTVIPHPQDSSHVTVAMSVGGVYRTYDGGASWSPANHGIQAVFLPKRYPEYGQCIHKMTMHPDRPGQMFIQNHHGVYRSDNGGDTWTSIAEGLPSDFGFPIAMHPHRPGTVYLVPLVSAGERMPPKGQLAVWRSRDAGETWEPLDRGLPTDGVYTSVLRDALCTDDADPAGVYVGTRDGIVYASANEGDSWSVVARHLPDVLCVRAAVID